MFETVYKKRAELHETQQVILYTDPEYKQTELYK